MSDSSIDQELFADDSKNDAIDRNDTKNFANVPEYFRTPEFQTFIKENEITPDNRHGYIQVFLYRDYYFPGQTVRGFAIIDLFNTLNSNKIFVRVKGMEKPGKHS